MSTRNLRVAGLIIAWFAALSAASLNAADDKSDASGVPVATQLRVSRGLTYLVSRQQPNGSFSISAAKGAPAARPSMVTPITSLCGLALLGSGSVPGEGEDGKSIEAAVNYVVSQQAANGCISEAPVNGMYSHAFATIFLAKAYQASRQKLPIGQNLSRSVNLLRECQSDAGGWRYTPTKGGDDLSVTLCQLAALRAVRNAGVEVPEETWNRAVGYLRGCQNPDGSFRYILMNQSGGSFSLTAGAVAALHWAGLKSSEQFDRARASLKLFIRTEESPETITMFYYGNFFCSQALWGVGGDAWSDWYKSMQTLLAKHQREDGSWNDTFSPEYGTAMACIILQTPRLGRTEPQPTPKAP